MITNKFPNKITNKLELNEALNAGSHAWPGGYPLVLVMADNEVLCWDCFRQEYSLIAQTLPPGEVILDPQWTPSFIEVNWENNSLHCGNCDALIECAYPFEEEEEKEKEN